MWHLRSLYLFQYTSGDAKVCFCGVGKQKDLKQLFIYGVKEEAQKSGLDNSQVSRLLIDHKIKGLNLAGDWILLSLDYKRKRIPGGRINKKM